MVYGRIMTEWIRLAIDDYPFSTRVAWIPHNGLPADVLLELQTIKQHEHIPLMIQNPNEPRIPGCYITNPEMPEAVYLSICTWKDIIEDKPHIIGPNYMDMVMDDDLDHDGFEGYKEELINNLPDWRKNIQRDEPANGTVVLDIFIWKFLD